MLSFQRTYKYNDIVLVQNFQVSIIYMEGHFDVNMLGFILVDKHDKWMLGFVMWCDSMIDVC